MTDPTPAAGDGKPTDQIPPESTKIAEDTIARHRELPLTYRVSDTLLSYDLSSDEAFQKIVNLIPEYLEYPEHGGVGLDLGDIKTQTDNFDSDRINTQCPIILNDETIGYIATSYDEQSPAESPLFRDQELDLLAAVSRVIVLYLKYRDARANVSSIGERLLLLDEILEKSPALIFVYDLEGDPDKIYVSHNIEQFGYSSEEFKTGKLKYQNIIHPEDLPAFEAGLSILLEEDLPSLKQQFRFIAMDGSIHWVRNWTYVKKDSEGKPKWVESIALDITETIEAESHARNYLETTNNLFLVLDKYGIVQDVNRRLCKLVGLSREALIGSNWMDQHVPIHNRASLVSYIGGLVKEPPGNQLRRISDVVSASGDIHTIDWSHSIELNAEGEFKSSIGFGIDITQQIVARKELEGIKQVLMENPNPVLRIKTSGEVIFANEAGTRFIIEASKIRYQGARSDWQNLLDFAVQADTKDSTEMTIDGHFYLILAVPQLSEGAIDIYGMNRSIEREMDFRLQRISGSLSGALFDYTMFADGTFKIENVSPGCEAIWEMTPDEIMSNPEKLWEMIHPEDFEAMQASVFSSRDNMTDWLHEWRIQPRIGKIKWLRGRGSPNRRTDGSTNWTTIILDITTEKSATASVETTLRQTVHALSAAVEARDPYTAGHQANVTLIALSIARAIGLETQAMSGLELAANVHDIGKIQIPAEILSKPGKLTAIEFELLKAHPTIGYDLLKHVDFTWPIADIVRQHHERMDGSGYPDGLAGEQILIEARILAVADVLEAMASDRPYRPALGIDAAMGEKRAGSGTRYDSNVVEACENQLDEIKMLMKIADQ